MRLRNKKTGETIDVVVNPTDFNTIHLCRVNTVKSLQAVNTWEYNSLAELNEEWEDYEEPKKFWFIDEEGGVEDEDKEYEDYIYEKKSIGNYFKTKEEAEKAVEKLKVWKWLKDNGVILKYDKDTFTLHIIVSGKMSPNQWRTDGYMQKLDLLFGGEE